MVIRHRKSSSHWVFPIRKINKVVVKNRNLLSPILAVFTVLVFSVSALAETRHLAHGIVLNGDFTQGGMVIGKAAPGTRLQFGARRLELTADGTFVFGFGRDDAADQQLLLLDAHGNKTVLPFRISTREYKIQRVNGLPPHTVTPPPDVMARIQREAAVVVRARNIDSPFADFRETFQWPAKGPITGVYGSQRIDNGEPRRPHFGVDIAAPRNAVIRAPADGVVTMAYPDMFFSGDTLIIDHGMGISTTYLHMNKMLVKKGQRVKQGQPIGLVGSKGRATGPHLCWRLNWFQVRLDPRLLMSTPAP